MQTCQPSLSRAINSTGQTMVGTKREAEVSGPDSPSKRQAQASGDVTCDMTRASCPLHSYIILDTPACFPPVAEQLLVQPGRSHGNIRMCDIVYRGLAGEQPVAYACSTVLEQL